MNVTAEYLRYVQHYLEHQEVQFIKALRSVDQARTMEGAEQFAPQVMYNFHAIKVLRKLQSDIASKISKAERKENGP